MNQARRYWIGGTAIVLPLYSFLRRREVQL